MKDNIQKIYGLIGFGLMTYHYYYHRTDSYSNIILIGYICLTLAFVPWFLKSEINHEIENKKEIETETNKENIMANLGHLLISSYYGYKLTYVVDLHSLLGFIANGLFITKYKKYSFILLLAFYSESIFHDHGNIGITALILFFYYQIINHKY